MPSSDNDKDKYSRRFKSSDYDTEGVTKVFDFGILGLCSSLHIGGLKFSMLANCSCNLGVRVCEFWVFFSDFEIELGFYFFFADSRTGSLLAFFKHFSFCLRTGDEGNIANHRECLHYTAPLRPPP
ncbi:hypothetical protein V8G54_027089 [Vigna mungo]|uniref:Uncharacterized protein n=1 Tax=Vigna mungo TaxID=3915 RepID=A0AAQ3MZX8_VIGMU